MSPRRIALLLALLWWWPQHAGAQVGAAVVFDPTNYQANQITALQSAVSAVNTAKTVLNQVRELLPLDQVILAADFAKALQLLHEVATEAAGLLGDVQEADRLVRQLFDLEQAPRTPVALHQRLSEIEKIIAETRRLAVCVQSLIATVGSAVLHVEQLVRLVSGLRGNMQSNQVQIQLLSSIHQTLLTQSANQMVMQRTEVLQAMTRRLVVESYTRIEADRWRGWPTWEGSK